MDESAPTETLDAEFTVTQPVRELGLLSVVAPVYNEEDSLVEFHRRITESLAGVEYEIVLVDDGSDGPTRDLLKTLAEQDPCTRVIRLSRNFGHQAALTAGLDHARGDAVVMLDSDLQDPPELIPKMIERWREGSDVVYAVRTSRSGETRMKLATARWFYRLFSKLVQIELRAGCGRLPAARPARPRCARRAARAQPLPARHDRLGRFHPDRDSVRARGAVRRRDQEQLAEHDPLLARRDLLVLSRTASGRDRARVHRLADRLPRDSGGDRDQGHWRLRPRHHLGAARRCCCSAASS